jgi:glutamate-ammonia-ligase adenylyltransferase
MRRALGSGGGAFDVKQDRGGIADIEFLVQYHVLRRAHTHPDVLRYTDNIRILEGLRDAQLLPGEDVELLMDAYRAFRGEVHRAALQEEESPPLGERLQALRAGVADLWARVMEGGDARLSKGSDEP